MSSRKRDPRMDTDPPSGNAPDSASARQRKATQKELHAIVAPAVAIRAKDPHARIAEIEAELTKERAERTAEADLMGQILARATQAEARVKILEQTLARVNEERTLAESQLQTVRAELEGLLADRTDVYTQTRTSLDSKPDTRPQMRAMRSLVLELLQVLDGVLTQGNSDHPALPSVRAKPSDRPRASDRPRGSDRPRVPTVRPTRHRP